MRYLHERVASTEAFKRVIGGTGGNHKSKGQNPFELNKVCFQEFETVFRRRVMKMKTKVRPYTCKRNRWNRYLKLTVFRHRNVNGTLLQQELHSATAITISTQIVINPFHAVDQYTCRPIVCVTLGERHFSDRKEWTTEHLHLTRNK